MAYFHNRILQADFFEDILFNNFTCLSTLIFRRVIAFEDQIKFDPKFNYLEDTDFLTAAKVLASMVLCYLLRYVCDVTKFRCRRNLCRVALYTRH